MKQRPGDLEVDAAGEPLVLLPERAIFWPRRSTLLVADPHFGKAAGFRASGIPVPSGTTSEGLTRLDAALQATGVERVVFLGDFLHAKEGRATGMFDAVNEWRHRNSSVDMVLVRGNHDRSAGDPPPELGVTCVDAPLDDPPYRFTHHPSRARSVYVIAGHLHPGVRLHGAGGLRARLPCFWFGSGGAVLPAFGDFTGLALVDPVPGDRVYAVAGAEVLEVQAAAPGSGGR